MLEDHSPSEVPADSAVRSMTGQGTGRVESELGSLTVELRSVNQRGLRVSPRMGDLLAPLEIRFEQLIRSQLKRGALQASVRFSPSAAVLPTMINAEVVAAYVAQLQQIRAQTGLQDPISLTGLLQLPGALCGTEATTIDPETVWPLLQAATELALQNLDEMRAAEGAAMAHQLRLDAAAITASLQQISTLAPQVVIQYRDRLESRITRYLEQRGLEVAELDLLREVQVYADRCDISEEITRLSSHLQLFADTLGGSEASGRKLDFIIQEMFRETNTIGSKASDAQIAALVVEIKCALERMRELVQNLE